MCGRFGLEFSDDFYPRFHIENRLTDFTSRYNIAPSQKAPVVINDNGKNEVQLMKWGLIPHWAKDPTIGNRLINARIEGILEKPSFRDSVKKYRCLVPATGFYEWKHEDSKKSPYLIHSETRKYIAFAGIYDIWQGKEGSVHSFSILTTEPNDQMRAIHNRMPVILDANMEESWLKDTDVISLLNEIKIGTSEKLNIYSISSLINNPSYDGPELLRKM